MGAIMSIDVTVSWVQCYLISLYWYLIWVT